MSDYGSEFRYRNRHLSNSRYIDPSLMDPDCGNSDSLFIKCCDCGVYMTFHPKGYMDGYWKCPDCGSRVNEMTVYNKLSRENDEWESKNLY